VFFNSNRTTGGSGSHNHNITVGNVGNHDHEFTTDPAQPAIQSTGGDEAHNNMPPYIVMNYIIKAVASL
jgi:microcystin-dependent protein